MANNLGELPVGRRKGIFITSIKKPESGWMIVIHCPICKVFRIVLNPWAIKPEKGDYWRMTQFCGEFPGHDMQMAQWGFARATEPVSATRRQKAVELKPQL